MLFTADNLLCIFHDNSWKATKDGKIPECEILIAGDLFFHGLVCLFFILHLFIYFTIKQTLNLKIHISFLIYFFTWEQINNFYITPYRKGWFGPIQCKSKHQERFKVMYRGITVYLFWITLRLGNSWIKI